MIVFRCIIYPGGPRGPHRASFLVRGLVRFFGLLLHVRIVPFRLGLAPFRSGARRSVSGTGRPRVAVPRRKGVSRLSFGRALPCVDDVARLNLADSLTSFIGNFGSSAPGLIYSVPKVGKRNRKALHRCHKQAVGKRREPHQKRHSCVHNSMF
jgi:hypothetical protein